MKCRREWKKLLFIPFQKKKSHISKNTISGWVRSHLHFVYTIAYKSATSLGKTTRVIHSVAASLALTSQIDIDEILRNCSWKSHTTFSEFCLKDMTQVHDDLHSPGPIVAVERMVALVE